MWKEAIAKVIVEIEEREYWKIHEFAKNM